jgi:hypothetical protein
MNGYRLEAVKKTIRA